MATAMESNDILNDNIEDDFFNSWIPMYSIQNSIIEFWIDTLVVNWKIILRRINSINISANHQLLIDCKSLNHTAKSLILNKKILELDIKNKLHNDIILF